MSDGVQIAMQSVLVAGWTMYVVALVFRRQRGKSEA
jgi:hypothetical protein